MPFSIYAQDSEFSVASGDNVNNGPGGPGSSTFDSAPNATEDLVITTDADDDDPRLFELGDTYDVRFGGDGGTVIDDAVVVRSDPGPGGGGIIVFEGVDQDGNPAQVLWTPGVDLEGWYQANSGSSAEPGFYTTDQNAAYTHGFVCFDAAARIATPHGQRYAGDLQPDDMVVTVDRGARPLRWVGQRRLTGREGMTPVLIREGALGNSAPLRLSPQHMVMIRSARAEMFFGFPEVLVPIRALVDGKAIRFAPALHITYVHLLLDQHEILLAEGAPCESLRAIPAWSQVPDAPEALPLPAARPILTYREAVSLGDFTPVAMPRCRVPMV
jgi:hypothetical protein